MTKNRKIFIILFVIIFVVSSIILYVLGLIPNELAQRSDENALDRLQEQTLETFVPGENEIISQSADTPTRIVANSINLNFEIENPDSANYELLNNELSKGAVHYPGSGSPGVGNMFLFGHSTSYKTVINKAYQVFNNIHNLNAGDEIQIYSKSRVYTYRVTSVNLLKDSEVFVSFATNRNKLTLSTCNSFGAKEDRYVVEADYVGSTLL